MPLLYRSLDNASGLTSNPALAQTRFVSGKDLFAGFDYPKGAPQRCAGNVTTNCLKANQNAAPVHIPITWSSQTDALFLGAAFFKTNHDLSYAKANLVFKLGGAESFTIPPGMHLVEVADAITGSRYGTVERDGAPLDSTPAIRSIGLANSYSLMTQNPALCPLPDALALLGYQCLDAAEANNPAILKDRSEYWSKGFQNSIRDLDLMRLVYRAYGKAF